jgi:hypothetical protein
MSVTFAPQYLDGDVAGYEVICDGCVVAEADSYVEAKRFAGLHEKVCRGECVGVGPEIREITDVPSVNLNNSNAHFILDLLGSLPDGDDGLDRGPFDCGDMSGECSAESFLGRVLLAQALGGSDVGRPASVLDQDSESRPGWVGGARVIDCGRPEGYADERLAQLAVVAEWAMRAGRSVTWA